MIRRYTSDSPWKLSYRSCSSLWSKMKRRGYKSQEIEREGDRERETGKVRRITIKDTSHHRHKIVL